MAKAPFLGDVDKIIAKHYQANRDAKGKQILDLVNADPGMMGRKISLSAVQTKLAEWHKEEKAQIAAGITINPLEQPWNIGACIEYGITADMIPVLIQMQRLALRLQKKITIRQAQWFARLYPSVKKLATRKWQDIIKSIPGFVSFLLLSLKEWGMEKLPSELLDPLKELLELNITNNLELEEDELEYFTLLLLAVIGIQYAKEEQISELLNREFSDTSELDNLFIKEEISPAVLIDGFFSAVTQVEQDKDKAKLRASFQGLSASELGIFEKRFGKKLTQKQIDIINSFIHVSFSHVVSIEQWIKQHPDEWDELNKLEANANERTHSMAI